MIRLQVCGRVFNRKRSRHKKTRRSGSKSVILVSNHFQYYRIRIKTQAFFANSPLWPEAGGFPWIQKGNTMKRLDFALGALPYYVPASFDEMACNGPKRKSLIRPPTSGHFVLPVRQSFVMDARIMPGTTRMLTLLAGWGGDGRSIDTTLGALGRKLSRSPRQIQRYLRDAAEEGYVYFRQITNRMGYVIGLRITLCKAAIFAPTTKKPRSEAQDPCEGLHSPNVRRNQATTEESDINKNIYIKLESKDPLDAKLASLGSAMGIPIQSG